MRTKVALFVILAVVMTVTQGCAPKQFFGAIVEGGGSRSYNEGGFGLELRVGGETRWASAMQDCAQDYSIMSTGVSITAYPFAPQLPPGSGTWKCVRIDGSGKKSDNSFYVANTMYNATTSVSNLYAFTVTWKHYIMGKTNDGRSFEKPSGQEYANVYYLNIEHVGMGK